MMAATPQEAAIDRGGCSGTRHGTYSAYRRYARFQQAGRPELCPDTTTHVDARPLRRRIRALYAIGHKITMFESFLCYDHALCLKLLFVARGE